VSLPPWRNKELTMRDLISNMTIVRGANQTLAGATPNLSRAFDLRGYNGATFYLETGAIADAGTADGFTMTLEHSDTLVGADFAAVPVAQLVGATSVVVTSDDADTVFAGAIGYNGNKRYVRARFVGTSGTDGVVHVVALLGKPHRAPTTPIGASLATT